MICMFGNEIGALVLWEKGGGKTYPPIVFVQTPLSPQGNVAQAPVAGRHSPHVCGQSCGRQLKHRLEVNNVMIIKLYTNN